MYYLYFLIFSGRCIIKIQCKLTYCNYIKSLKIFLQMLQTSQNYELFSNLYVGVCLKINGDSQH